MRKEARQMRKLTERVRKHILFCVALVMVLALTGVFAYGMQSARAEAGDVPAHSKTITDNGDGTYKLELSVTGDADPVTQEAGAVNVLVVYDTSSSMTSNAQGSSYSRADQAEDVIHDFLTKLAGYQNDAKDNINVALVTFAVYTDQHNQGQAWTTNVTALANRFDDGGTDRQTSMSYSGGQSNGTNWDAALNKASGMLGNAPGEDVPTFVIMITDGAPTASGNGNNAIAPTGASIAQLRNFYNAATDDARAVALACEETDGTFYGIYAYGTEADLLDDLMYYSENNQHRDGNINNVVEATQEAPNFFLASNTADLNAAIDEIFAKVVQAMGISSVTISDGTTNQVATSTGIAELLEVDESSYQYWLSIPVVSNSFTRVNSDGNTIEYKVTDNGDGTCTVEWNDGGSKSVTVDGSVSGGQFKYEWKEANALYDFAPPAAKLNNDNGAVDWNLSSVGTLLDGVTYSVTFNVYPSQTTLDIVADIKNDPGKDGAWGELDENIQKYITVDGELVTNTTATLSYTDTRTGQSGSATYQNPDPVENSAVEQMAVTKKWENELDKQVQPSVTLTVTRDGKDAYEVELNDGNNWAGSVWISVGIMGADGKPLKGSEGHDFTFTEPDEVSYHWEIDVPTVHPMLINNVKTMLIKVDEKHPVPDGTDPDDVYEFNDATYYKDEEAVSLTATNYRRSSLILTKVVEGGNVPEDAVFPFTLNVVNALAPDEEPEDDPNHDSDYWVWISVRDKDGARINEGVTGATASGKGDGWWYAPSGTEVTIPAKAGYSIRVNNLPTGTTYTITEGDLPAGFIFKEAAIEVTEGEGTADEFEGGQVSTGEIESTNTLYTVTYTNEYAVVTVTVDKEWQDNNDSDKVRPDELVLTLNGAPVDYEKEPEIKKSDDGNTWTYTWTDLPKYDSEDEEIQYTVTEEEIPDGYECETPTAENGGTIINIHEPKLMDIEGKKTWDDNNDQDKLRPAQITVNLLADGEKVDSITVTAENGWAYIFEGVPKYNDNDEEILYTITEEPVPEYETTITGFNITNKHTPKPPEIKTGDDFRMMSYVVALGVSGLGIVGTGTWIGLRRKRFHS